MSVRTLTPIGILMMCSAVGGCGGAVNGSPPKTAAAITVTPAKATSTANIGEAGSTSFPESLRSKGALSPTVRVREDLAKTLPFSARSDFEDASRGFIGTRSDMTIKGPDGHVVWSIAPYAFLEGKEAPPTINPSLWRIAQLNLMHGLFKVTDRIYQVRGFDLANVTFVEGTKGVIVIDPLTSKETAKAAMDLYFDHRPRRPIVAVVYTHSHVDHYGGVRGIVSEEDVKAGKVKVLAPEGFLEHAVSENVFAGNAMSRRALYMYGALLPKGERGQVDGGLGKTVSSGEVTLIPPTDYVKRTEERRTIDGVEMIFQMAPRTEAPAEFLIYFPQMRALCTAEDATHTLHNVYTLRGAEVRDAAAWWKALNESIDLFGDRADVVFASHHWPTWGKERIASFLGHQRDAYKYIHDQSLRLLNQGKTMTELAEMVKLPPALDDEWYNRGYYGSVNHDAKGVYQKYLGWYDSNPAHLHLLPPEQGAKKYVEYMGGAHAVIAKARESFAKGEYRWVAEVMAHVVFADPSNQEARALEADALEQMGYATENATWRNEYLMGARELREGVPKATGPQSASPDTVRAMTVPMFLDYLGMRLDGPRAVGKTIAIELRIPESSERYALRVENGVLTYSARRAHAHPDAVVTLARAVFDDIALKRSTLDAEVVAGRVKLEGSREKMGELLSLLDTFDPLFPIVTP